MSCKPQAEGFQAGRRYSREHPHIAECYPSRKPAEDQSWPKQDVCFLDVKKAFDSVSHDSLLIACRRLGVPEPLLEYIHGLYEQGATCLQSCGEQSTPISCKQGVKQGDPLSCFIFNAVIDWVLTSIDPKFSFQYVDHLLSYPLYKLQATLKCDVSFSGISLSLHGHRQLVSDKHKHKQYIFYLKTCFKYFIWSENKSK